MGVGSCVGVGVGIGLGEGLCVGRSSGRGRSVGGDGTESVGTAGVEFRGVLRPTHAEVWVKSSDAGDAAGSGSWACCGVPIRVGVGIGAGAASIERPNLARSPGLKT